jgi:RNA polymerase sigma-70 factor, ECF subfamily
MIPADAAPVQRLGPDLTAPPPSAGLFPLVSAELWRLARHYLSRERSGHTLQATALVHEVYLRLMPAHPSIAEDRARFVGIAAHVMRQILVDHARARHRLKRGRDYPHVSVNDDLAAPDAELGLWEELERALTRLETLSPRQAQVVELRYFGGLTVDEAAEVLDVSAKTVKRDWIVARAWLRRELGA